MVLETNVVALLGEEEVHLRSKSKSRRKFKIQNAYLPQNLNLRFMSWMVQNSYKDLLSSIKLHPIFVHKHKHKRRSQFHILLHQSFIAPFL